MKNIIYNNYELKELQEIIIKNNEKKFRANQIFEGLHKKLYFSFDEMTNLPKCLKDNLLSIGKINQSSIYKVYKSKIDKTRKYLIKLEDGNIIESVYMEYKSHSTICISSQAGCKMGCTFCASTKAKFGRNLQVSELLNQIYLISKDVNKRINNIVLMGIGEPLDNYENVIKFIKIITDESGYNISARNITLSTCGIVPKIYELSEENIPINLTISLHNPFDFERNKIMPIGNKYLIKDIIEASKYYFNKTGRRISFEYTLIEKENDSYEHAKELKKLLRGLNCHINLIPLNKIKEFNKEASDKNSIEKFKQYLIQFGIPTTIRTSLGKDIDGACGQLRVAHSVK